MLFEGRFGIGGGSRAFFEVDAGDVSDWCEPGRCGVAGVWAMTLLSCSGFNTGRGGGYGDMDKDVTDAEWAW